MKLRKIALPFAIASAAIFIAVIYAIASYSSTGWDVERVTNAFFCRASVFLQKAKGDKKEFSWREIVAFTTLPNGFTCITGRSLESSVIFSAVADEKDLKAGSHIFNERCKACHGADGSGGPHAPSLMRSNYQHGDSDLALYRILRDGISGTAMPSFADLSLRERLQVVAYLNQEVKAKPSKSQRLQDPRRNIDVTSENLIAAGANPEEWLMYSGSYNGWRHSPLSEITPANATQLRVRWVKQFDTNEAKLEATPLVIDGIIFTVAPFSAVVALDAKTGEQIWKYKRPLPDNLPLCCGHVNRGLAAHGHTLFYGSPDGYLVAIDAKDSTVIWESLVGSSSEGYSMTGAPLVVNHSVVVGVAGGDYGVRGFLAAYDVSTGERQWKFETIPGPGEVGHHTWENDAWRTGGGATWNTGSYDPSADLLYWGVGNPSPDFSGDVRPGDNLFTNSVIALHASTGKLAWYFQFTPHDEHDWDSAQTPILADLLINGKNRKVICWLNRNGFYYILDRLTGEFLSGVPFVELNWAIGLTPEGRPIFSEIAKVTATGRLTTPGADGGTNWQNPSFDQKRGSIFVPANLGSSIYTNQVPERVRRERDGSYLGSSWSQIEPPIRVVRALDVFTGQQKWEYKSSDATLDCSGLLSTGGGVVFGASAGAVFALDAETGSEVWRVSLGGNTLSSPISFAVNGRQVIAVTAGRALFLFGL